MNTTRIIVLRHSLCANSSDEAGRGPLAGPVVAAACYIPYDVPAIPGIHDSKALTEGDREAAYEVLINDPRIFYGVSIVSHTEIDQINILQASLTGMTRAANSLLDKFLPTLKTSANNSASSLDKFIALVDGNKIPQDLTIASQYVIKGDSKIYSIAAASIIAKVTRDRIMVELDAKYPIYFFAQHKGYPTAMHRALLLQHGPCDVHRITYAPVKNAIEIHAKKAMKATSCIKETLQETEENGDEGESVVKKVTVNKSKKEDYKKQEVTGKGKKPNTKKDTKKSPKSSSATPSMEEEEITKVTKKEKESNVTNSSTVATENSTGTTEKEGKTRKRKVILLQEEQLQGEEGEVKRVMKKHKVNDDKSDDKEGSSSSTTTQTTPVVVAEVRRSSRIAQHQITAHPPTIMPSVNPSKKKSK